jgi:hypothetical protein
MTKKNTGGRYGKNFTSVVSQLYGLQIIGTK